MFAASRIGADGREILVAFNTSTTPLVAQVEVEPASTSFSSLLGKCNTAPDAPGSLMVELPALGYVACLAGAP